MRRGFAFIRLLGEVTAFYRTEEAVQNEVHFATAFLSAGNYVIRLVKPIFTAAKYLPQAHEAFQEDGHIREKCDGLRQ